jgi:hypothetical protein
LTEGNENNEGLQPGRNIIFVSFVIFCLGSSVRSLLCFWFALIRDIRAIRGCCDLTLQRFSAAKAIFRVTSRRIFSSGPSFVGEVLRFAQDDTDEEIISNP